MLRRPMDYYCLRSHVSRSDGGQASNRIRVRTERQIEMSRIDEIRERQCSQCGVVKPLEEFYPIRRGSPKRRRNCKTCCAVTLKAGRDKDLQQRRYESWKVRNARRVKGYKRKYTETHRLDTAQRTVRWRKANPEKTRAHRAVQNALRSGKLRRPARCRQCNSRGTLHGHHADYSRPLEVLWLCELCHRKVHSHA